MDKKWPTKDKDLYIAQAIIKSYAKEQDTNALGLFELVVNQEKKRMNFRLANWVVALSRQFNSMYGSNHGDFVTRRVISRCIIRDETIH